MEWQLFSWQTDCHEATIKRKPACASTPFRSARTRPRKSMSSSRCRSAASRSSTRWTRPPARWSSTASSIPSMRYPGNYGFIPHTLSDDGDPCDVLIANQRGIIPGAVVAVRPVGVLKMQDEAGGDEKIVAVPTPKLTRRYENVHNYTDLPEITLPADRALLRALQGSGTRQVGQGSRLGRCRRSREDDHGSRSSAPTRRGDRTGPAHPPRGRGMAGPHISGCLIPLAAQAALTVL